MRKLIIIIVSLGVLWGGYWFVGSNAVEKGLTSWLSDTSNRGWVAKFSALNTKGFPNRFDTTFNDLKVEIGNGDLTWAVPFFQIFALSYKPNHIIAVWPNEQTLLLPKQRLAITSDRMRGSIKFRPETALTLSRSSVEISNFHVQSNLGWSTSAETGQFNTRQSEEITDAHDVVLQTLKLRLSDQFMSFLDPEHKLPDQFEAVKVELSMGFDGPWDRLAIEQKRPNLTGVGVKNLQIVWGELEFSATGKLTTDTQGFLSGKLEITAQNWRGIYKILVRMGLIQGSFMGAVEGFLQIMALETEDPDLLVADWVFQDGRMRLGAIPLGPAPRIVRR
ncbi:MAG: DUF2125 domain-containing protein [Paracoccaceae bacterium]